MDALDVMVVNLMTLNTLYEKGFYGVDEYVKAINNILQEWRSHVPQNN